MTNLVQGKNSLWEVIIGLEVHAQILSKSKLFSSSKVGFGDEPNSNVSFIDVAMPGVLPVPNRFCIEQAIKTGLALNGSINLVSYFDRKHYFYPDSPFGYQITQFYKPIMENGFFTIEIANNEKKQIGINRLHIEADAGKLLHDQHPNKSFVDLNRVGTGLMEIVSEPDFRSKEEVADYVTKLRILLRSIGVCDGNMEEGSLRCDVNVSVRKPDEELRNRVEIKNLNSIKFIQEAIEYEVNNQIEIWENGDVVIQQTKLFDTTQGVTYALRTKEDADDYRYVREPDILPLVFTKTEIDSIRDTIPELPEDKKQRFTDDFGLSADDAMLLAYDNDNAEFYEEAVKDNIQKNPKMVANFLITNLFGILNANSLDLKDSKITPIMLAQLVDLVEDGTISGKIAKEVFEKMWETSDTPSNIVEKEGLVQITDVAAIENIVINLIENNQDKVVQIREGKNKLIGWFVGQVMQETQGKANPAIVNELLKKHLNV